MRYLNWDILIFPDDTKVPVQEFDVKCQALPAASDTPLSPKLINAAGNDYNSSITQTPTMTCFIASLDAGHAFRVSVHSWEKPRPSSLLSSFKPAPERITFEAKLFIDGTLKAQRWLRQNSTWPEVISDTSTPLTEFPTDLRFPPFHSEILQQSHWDAGDGLGRIRLVIAEGIARPDVNSDILAFRRLRDVVAFSFQHAPQHILDHSGIAWPNARMFQKKILPKPQSDFQAHAHSPQRSGKQYAQTPMPIPGSMHASASWSSAQALVADDPFVGPSVTAKSFFERSQRKAHTDVSMSDYPTKKNESEMSDVAIQPPNFQQQVGRANVEEIIRALTPSKRAALLHALSPSDRPEVLGVGAVPNSRVMSIKSLDKQTLQARSVPGTRKSSLSSRSTSGNSTAMSWDESPTLGDLWSSSSKEFPGLLPSLQKSGTSERSTSCGSKRRRTLSPPTVLQLTTDSLPASIRGMSTSPCKKSPTPKKANQRSVAEKQSDSSEEDEDGTIEVTH
ncbi:hypothetical protein LTR64_003921 [Lithohypha guttulata]|uniref:uncharacterized protein n=1 Tax=Lithohypha guttulata TaxID=1690604 RepID=UPI002DDF3845|nr:2-isopropylmalate synthase (Alpha-isopropylmalate synthase) (Alpha-IPM synthetase) [Lithohypha guttulata]